jgi:superfamily II DNA or RNA helicase
MTISDLDKLEGVEFEQALKAPLLTIGFSEIIFTPKTADFGADVIAKKGNRKCAIQIKRSTSPISISAVQEVLGASHYYECVEGWVITNSIFTPGAVELAKRAKVQLVARDQLKQWLSKLKLADKTTVIKPFPYQTEALTELARYRAGRKSKSLVIMAAGLGKTYTSALDVAQFESGLGRPARVMFIAHQSVILEQGSRAFRQIFGSSRSFGHFDGVEHDKKKDFLFATFQSVERNLASFDKDEFDYIIVDEAHHTPAETRDRVVSYFVPLFLLGLTATPSRFDGKDITKFFDDNIAINLPLEKSLARGLLTPIDYRVYTDKAETRDLLRLLKGTKDIEDDETLGKNLFRPRSDKEIVNLVNKISKAELDEEKILVFCNSLEQMDHFSRLFPNCRTISGRDSRDRQIELVDQFKRGDFGILLSRDVLNEGIDVPDANMVVFLRNSESPVVFLQQLGRGLRKSLSKKRVIVLDFVCNIDRIRYVYSFCSKLKNYFRNETSNKITGDESVPESTVQFDEQARDIVEALLAKKVLSGLLVPLSSIVTALDHSIAIATLKKINSLGHIIADYDLPSKNGGLEQYFESDTVQRFIRQVLKKSDNPALFDENYVSKLIKRKPTDLHRMEKWGQFTPSWFHRTPSGRTLFYYSEADIAKLQKLNRT